ncbi:methylated-DNA--[protein]-cysteine S-methyltransferase [Neobacillus notoginsengisoli]|uniref:methylated-DNA--[protein]-cysteine S-methyltransferase n=1 Tax=Neobacillus notoginsengisoli TaxID=1578198 RepID=A0A417YWC7_9BACI|nr:methylated-DNA--[protein]-cysteine S-methyltransferase [Neobacillus notoginsengisoli]RHW41710.1 methylated-DNA--[protein]-cysteine S-methyltransferase [Neobacillus notoginsengisoli]
MANSPKSIYWSMFENKIGPMVVAATEKGLCYVGSPGKGIGELEKWAVKYYPGSSLNENEEVVKIYTAELAEYLEGKKQSFSGTLDFKGTPFQESIWAALREIPYGKTTSYSEIAQLIGKPAAVRAVGTAIGANPLLIAIPCHRVIGKSGAITGYRGGLEMKQHLLQLESAGTK